MQDDFVTEGDDEVSIASAVTKKKKKGDIATVFADC